MDFLHEEREAHLAARWQRDKGSLEHAAARRKGGNGHTGTANRQHQKARKKEKRVKKMTGHLINRREDREKRRSTGCARHRNSAPLFFAELT
jgi:50S ribosomal subunit-associated GTPase HflX